MKKTLAMLLATSMLLLAGCGSQSAAPSEAPAEKEPAATAAPAEKTEAPADADPYADYPNKPVEVTVQWDAGGGADVVFRALAEVFPDHANGQPLVVKNVGGASGVTGSTEFMNATPDGYQFIHINTAHISKMHMSNVPYDATTFVPVSGVCGTTNYLLVRADSPWETLEDFIADAKANPGMITIGNAGTGGGNHLGSLLFEQAAEAEFSHIPFDGGNGAITGILSNEVDGVVANSPEGLTNVEAGELKILGNFGSARFTRFPELPTSTEDGFPLVIEQWRGIAVPEGTPVELIDKLDDIIKACVEDPKFEELMAGMDTTPVYMETAEFTDFVAQQDTDLMTLIKDNGLGDRY